FGLRVERPTGTRSECKGFILHETCLEPFDASPCDHGSIVAAKSGRRCYQTEAVHSAKTLQCRTEFAIGGDAAGDDQNGLCDCGKHVPEAFETAADALLQGFGDGALEGGADVADCLVVKRSQFARRRAHGGREAGRGNGRPRLPLKRTRKGAARGIASFGSLLHARTSGIGQAEALGRLVESLAASAAYRGRPACVAADAGYEHDLRMPSRYEEEQIGKFDTVGQAGGQ